MATLLADDSRRPLPPGDLLRRHVAQVRRRMTLAAAADALPWCAASSMLVGAFVIAWGQWTTPLLPWSTVLGAVTGSTLVLTLLVSRLRRPEPLAAAIELDRRCRLQERVSSAVAAMHAAPALVRDAEAKLATIDARREFPIIAPAKSYWPVAVGGLALAAALAVSPPDSPTAESATTSAEETAQVRANLAALRREFDEQKTAAEKLQAAEALRLLDRLQERARKLETGAAVDRREALLQLSEMANDLAARRNDVQAAEALAKQLKRLQSKKQAAASPLADAFEQGDLGAAAEMLSRLQNDLATKPAGEQSRADLADELDDLRERLGRTADEPRSQTTAEPRTPAERPDAQRQMSPAGGESQDTNDPAAAQLAALKDSLAAAAEAQREGDVGAQSRTLDNLQKQLEGLAEQAAEAQLLRESLVSVAECKAGISRGSKPDVAQAGSEAAQPGRGRGAGDSPGGRNDGNSQSGQGRTGSRSAAQAGSQAGVGEGAGPADKPVDTAAEGAAQLLRARGEIRAGALQVAGAADGPNAKGKVLETIRRQAAGVAQEGEAQKVENQPLDRAGREQKRQYFDALRSR